jgi:hypothetical protein
MIHRDVEKALDLPCVQIHRQHAVRTGSNEQICHEFGGDRNARLILAILPGITIKRNDRGDSLRRRPAGCIDHDEQLNEVMIGRRAGRLDNENVLAPDVFVDLHERFSIRETGDGGITNRQIDVGANLLSQRPV